MPGPSGRDPGQEIAGNSRGCNPVFVVRKTQPLLVACGADAVALQHDDAEFAGVIAAGDPADGDFPSGSLPSKSAAVVIVSGRTASVYDHALIDCALTGGPSGAYTAVHGGTVGGTSTISSSRRHWVDVRPAQRIVREAVCEDSLDQRRVSAGRR
jgi:hypothetical protein